MGLLLWGILKISGMKIETRSKKNAQFSNLSPGAESCRPWHLETLKRAIDYKKTFLCGLLVYLAMRMHLN